MVLTNPPSAERFDVLATNIQGMGAVRLAQSLLPALERVAGEQIERLWLPDRGPIADYGADAPNPRYRRYRRFLPNAISRVVESTIAGQRLGSGRIVLTLGDIPISVARRQVVFVQSAFILSTKSSPSLMQKLKGAISRALFVRNLPAVDAVIVQTETMRSAVAAACPTLAGRIHIIAQPAPQWLLDEPRRDVAAPSHALRLFFPAAGYPHKNHALLRDYAGTLRDDDPIDSIGVTIAADGAAAPAMRFLGTLAPDEIVAQYRVCDALVFPSLEESYGLPLIEAMYLGLPILAADLPYAHELCGDQAIYFDPRSTDALRDAVTQLAARLAEGWRPDWTARLARIPADWDDVARQMVAVIDGAAR